MEMMFLKQILIFILLIFGHRCFVESKSPKFSVSKDILDELYRKVSAEQCQKTEPFVNFNHLYHKKGVFASYVKLNFYGGFSLAEARKLFSIYDNNMFATAWVTSSLLEGHLMNKEFKLTEDQLISAIDSMVTNHDKNKPYNNSLMGFWEQRFNDTLKYYQSTPLNLLGLMNSVNDKEMSELEKLLKFLGLEKLSDELDYIFKMRPAYVNAFHIPPDFDDTFVNLGLGSLLNQAKDEFPNAWKHWASFNTNLTSVFDAVKKYAYRPFSNDPNVNSIDPRTYYWNRGFLDQAKAEKKDVALITTWIQNINEMRTQYFKGVGMPFGINNVDCTVAANTIYGMTASILDGLVSPTVLDDPLIEMVYHNTSAMIAFQINTNMTSRPDLALLYYPSQVEFDWFVARTVDLLERTKSKGQLPKPVMETVYAVLKNATEGEMTKHILSKAQSDGKGGLFYDDFLGDGDLSLGNKPLVRGEDRIFTTAMAANALLYTWTSLDEHSGQFFWKEGVPANVKTTVTSCVQWLTEHSVGSKYEPWNAFFSGSLKTMDTMAYYYPINLVEYYNGTVVTDVTKLDSKVPFLVAVKGYIEPKDYEELIKLKKPFGHTVPTIFNGYNTGSFPFPLWSSPAYTYSTTMLALERYSNVAY